MKKVFILLTACALFVACDNQKKETTVEKEQKNEVVENILSRRSIRVYKPEQIKSEELDTILKCGMFAPSALNKQSWEVRVIQNADLLSRINATFVEKAKGKSLKGSASRAQEPGFSVFHNAPTLIVVAKTKDNPYSAVDCGLFAQNILLSAASLNIGTCVVGNTASILNDPDSKKFLEEINMPDTHEVVFGITVGYPNESPVTPDRDEKKIQIIK